MDNVAFLFWLLLALGGGLALLDWRKGFAVVILAGFIQDPLRKLTPGEPVYLTITVGGVLLLVMLGALLQGRNLGLAPIYVWYRRLATPLNLFILLVFIQAAVTLVKYGNPVLAFLGLLAYLGPLPALVLAYQYADRVAYIRRWLQAYLVGAVVMTLSVYLAYLGYESALFDVVGSGIIIYAPGGILESFQGIMRSSEISAWHGGAAACLLIVLYVAQGNWLRNLWMVLLVFAFIGVILLSGRRKILFELVLFIGVYGALLLYFQRGAVKLALFTVLLGLSVLWGLQQWLASDETLVRYVDRGSTAFEDAPERLELTGWQAIQWSIDQHGWLGGGAGIASQGGQYYGGGVQLGGGGAEGGIGKIVAELGVPAVFLLLWVGWELARYLWRILDYARRTDPQMALYSMGLLAFLAANLPVYVVATQAYGDLFVLILLGSCLGMVLATPRIIKLRQQRAAALTCGT